MQFNSVPFLIFFLLVCSLMALTNIALFRNMDQEQRMRIRHVFLLLASYVFYGWWNWKCCGLMLLLTLVSHFCSLQMGGLRQKSALFLGVAVPLIVLGVFKYFNFFVDSFCQAFGIVRTGSLNILLPVGISFYTFQSLSYTIDVSRGRIAPEHDFVRTALYISFFPQLVAGPIVKAGDFIPQLHEERSISLSNLETGVQIFVFGLFKKIVLADNLSVFVDAIHEAPAAYSGLTLLLAAYAYAIQIYCDFSGYSDMAVGCARILGYDLPRNFNLPYLSRNVTEFWKRWHISLSSWLQQYLYIPLGGNRRGRMRTYINLMLTMLIGGLWHGANWTFVVWGGLHGIALCVHKLWMQKRETHNHIGGNPFWSVFSILLTFHWAAFCFVFFRAQTISTALFILAGIFTMRPGVTHIAFWAVASLLLVGMASLAACLRNREKGVLPDGYYPLSDLSTVRGLTVFFTFLGLTLALGYTGQSPFIYFQF